MFLEGRGEIYCAGEYMFETSLQCTAASRLVCFASDRISPAGVCNLLQEMPAEYDREAAARVALFGLLWPAMACTAPPAGCPLAVLDGCFLAQRLRPLAFSPFRPPVV